MARLHSRFESYARLRHMPSPHWTASNDRVAAWAMFAYSVPRDLEYQNFTPVFAQFEFLIYRPFYPAKSQFSNAGLQRQAGERFSRINAIAFSGSMPSRTSALATTGLERFKPAWPETLGGPVL